MTDIEALIIKMRLLQVDMVEVSRELEKQGITMHELDGASSMISTWIDGIKQEFEGDQK